MTNFKSLIFIIFFLLMITTHFLYSQSLEDLISKEENQLKLSRDKIITRITKLPNSNTHKCQAVGVIYAPIDKIWEVINDYNHFKDFMPRIKESFIVNPAELKEILDVRVEDWKKFEKYLKKFKLEQINGDLIYFYNRFNLPWPFKNRYYILKMVRHPESFSFRWTQFIGNTKVNDGSWELIPFKGSKRKTLGIYTLITDPGVAVSPSLCRFAMKITLPGTIKSVRKRMLKLFLEEKENAQTQPFGNF